MSKDLQPPFKWLFFGPAGTQSKLHVDVWETDAWLGMLEGSKTFTLYHPAHRKHIEVIIQPCNDAHCDHVVVVVVVVVVGCCCCCCSCCCCCCCCWLLLLFRGRGCFVVVVLVVLLSLGMRNTKISAITLLYSRLFSTNMISPSPPRNMTNLTMRATFATVSQRDHQCTCGSTFDTRESQALGTLQNSLVRISGWTSALKPQA